MDIKKTAMGFEAVKVSMSQNRDGIILRLSVHPNDCPPELHTDWVGSRYMVGMQKIDDFEQPDVRADQKRIEKMVSSAGLLCRNEAFWEFLEQTQMDAWDGKSTIDNEEDAVAIVYYICGIKSRKELRSNDFARQWFEQLRKDFIAWKS